MSDYGASTYGEGVADVYDEWYPGGDPAPIVHRLQSLSGGGPVLELGIGTGRIALPLAATGVSVHIEPIASLAALAIGATSNFSSSWV